MQRPALLMKGYVLVRARYRGDWSERLEADDCTTDQLRVRYAETSDPEEEWLMSA